VWPYIPTNPNKVAGLLILMCTTQKHAKRAMKQHDFVYRNYVCAHQVNVYFKLPEAVIHNSSIVDNNIKVTKHWHCCLEWFCKQYHLNLSTFSVFFYFYASTFIVERAYLHIVGNLWHHTGKRLPCLCHILLRTAELTAPQPLYLYHKLKPAM